LVETGVARDDAYRVVQRLAQRALGERTQLRELLAADPAGQGLDLDAIFDYDVFVRYAGEIVGRLDTIAGPPGAIVGPPGMLVVSSGTIAGSPTTIE